MKADSMILPASPATALREVIDPGLALLPATMHTGTARVLVLGICMQESGLSNRVQMGGGPAHGLPQFERGGGVRGVLTHPASRGLAADLCAHRGIVATEQAVWAEMAIDDLLAVAMARLLLYTDPRPLPVMGDADGAWAYYESIWRPGKPRPNAWKVNYPAALRAIEGH